jgi:hypothetical protein
VSQPDPRPSPTPGSEEAIATALRGLEMPGGERHLRDDQIEAATTAVLAVVRPGFCTVCGHVAHPRAEPGVNSACPECPYCASSPLPAGGLSERIATELVAMGLCENEDYAMDYASALARLASAPNREAAPKGKRAGPIDSGTDRW